MVKPRVPKEEVCHQCSLTPNAHATHPLYIFASTCSEHCKQFFFPAKKIDKKMGKVCFPSVNLANFAICCQIFPEKNIDCKDTFGRIKEC